MSQSNTNNDKTQSSSIYDTTFVEWGGLLNEFLWICSGADRKVLRQCPTDYAKYAGIGGTILSTAIMAMFSGGYALFSIFSDPDKLVQDTSVYIMTAIFAVFWSLLIFNLDRFMVNTMYSDGTHAITSEELKGGLPRIVLAVFLGLVISTPIEMRIFNDKIMAQVVEDQISATNKMNKTNQSLADQIQSLEEQKRMNNKRVDDKRSVKAKIEDDAYKEATGHGLSGKAGIGNYTKQLQERAKSLDKEIVSAQKETDKANAAIDRQLEVLYDKQSKSGENIDKSVNAMKGFTARFNALHEVTSPSNSINLFIARLCIMLLFVAIEVIPTLFKMMIASGPYDDILRAEKYRIRAMAEKSIKEVDDLIKTSITISTEKSKARLEAELKANEGILKKLSDAQSELIEVAINEWKRQELEKIKNNPSVYIDSSTTNS